MEVSHLLVNLTLIFTTAVVFGFLAKKLHQPVILGYLVGGLIVGGITGANSLANREEIALFAEIGIALLMFLLGIEFSFRRFRRVGTIVIWGATIQILATMLLGTFIFRLFGLDFYSALFLGSVFSLSSTAVVVKILSDEGLISTVHGEISLGWLLLQDLAVLPIVVLLPAIAASYHKPDLWDSLLTLGKGIGLGALYVTVILIVGRYIVSFIFNLISKTGSRELLVLSAFLFCILLSGLADWAGLSFALGAFLGGMLISQTAVLQAVFAEMRPLRDLFATVFFVSLGFLINPFFILSSWPLVLGLVVLVIFLKFLLVFGLTFSFGFHSKIAFLTAVSLVQVGEFAFILAQLGVSQKIISDNLYSLILSVAIITIVFTPPLIKNSSFFYRKLYPWARKFAFLRDIFEKKTMVRNDANEYNNHIILIGYGRVGSYIGRALMLEKIPFVVVDYNRFVIDGLGLKGVSAVYGDPANLEVLSFVNIQKARALIIALPDLETQEAVIINAQTLNKNLKIYCRTHFEEDQPRLKSLGVNEVIQPEFEASLTIIHKLFADLGISEAEINRRELRLKIEHGTVSS